MARLRDGRVACDARTACDGAIAPSETAAEKLGWQIVRKRLPEGREQVSYTCDVCVGAPPGTLHDSQGR